MARRRLTVAQLDEPTCRKLLGAAPMGRVGFTDRALPRILPVHCVLRDDEVVMARRHGATLDVRPDEIVAFEIDEYHRATGEGWCVSLVGTCRVVEDSDEIAELDALAFAPWSSEEGTVYIAISPGLLHGRAVTATAETAVGAEA